MLYFIHLIFSFRRDFNNFYIYSTHFLPNQQMYKYIIIIIILVFQCQIRSDCSCHFTGLTHSPESLHIQQKKLCLCARILDVKYDIMSSVSVRGFLQQHYRRYYSPKSCRCGAALLTWFDNANLPCMHKVNEQDQLTPLCSPPTRGSHSVRDIISQHSMTDLEETCNESKAEEIIWSISDVSGDVLSTAALKMLWASCGKAKQSTVYGSSSLCQSSSINPSILFCFLFCQLFIRPPSSSFPQSDFENTTSDQI